MNERQAHLLAYAIAWLSDNAGRQADLLRPKTLSRLWASLRSDLACVLVRFGLQLGAAEDLVAEATSQVIGDLAAQAAKKVGLEILGRIRGAAKGKGKGKQK